MSWFIEAAILARLIEIGAVRESKRNLQFIKRYETALWLERSARKAEWVVREGCRDSLERRLTEITPGWKEDFAFLRTLNLSPFDPNDIRSLPVLKKELAASGVINRRNWNAASGISPKHKSKLRSEAILTADWIMRLRPSRRLKCIVEGQVIDLYRDSLIYTECCLTERMWHKLATFTGTQPETLITCENLGAYIDLPIRPTTLVVYSPGKDTVAVIELLRKLPDTRWIHFGDLDPAGLMIARTIADAAFRDMKIYIPSFASDYLPGASLKEGWGDFKGLEHPVITELMKTNRRIFQEVFMLDPRLSSDLETYLRSEQFCVE